jgi:hypothetical protein
MNTEQKIVIQNLHDDTKEKYLEKHTRCPFCDSESIVSQYTNHDEQKACVYDYICCLNCLMSWKDIYRLWSVDIAVKCESCDQCIEPGEEVYAKLDDTEDRIYYQHPKCMLQEQGKNA